MQDVMLRRIIYDFDYYSVTAFQFGDVDLILHVQNSVLFLHTYEYAAMIGVSDIQSVIT